MRSLNKMFLFSVGVVSLTFTGVAHGDYLYKTLDVPNASETCALGIDGKNIVGWYKDASGYHGFLYNGSTYTTFNVPGATNTNTKAYGISGNNIVGTYQDASLKDHGFLYNGSSYTTFNLPGAKDTWPSGISGNNIAGWYTDANGHYHGFIAIPSIQTYIPKLQVTPKLPK